jgi:hypothetical protein
MKPPICCCFEEVQRLKTKSVLNFEPDLLRAMILRGAMPDVDTYSLIRLIEQFKI